MSRPSRFGSVLTAMVTPFDDDGNLDLDGAVALARWLADHGSDGLVIAGSTGEATALSDDEKRDMWRAVADAVTIPVVAGSGTADTRHSVELTQAAEAAGVAGILAVTPYYSRPPQAGIEAHFRAVAAATRLPVLVYDIPIRAGRKLGHDLLVRLAHEVRNVVGVKDASGDPAATARLVADVPEDFDVISGEDVLTLALLAVGARGVISVESHWAGRPLARMIAAFRDGQVDEARRLNARLIPSHTFQSGDLAPNPVPTKAMLRVLGLPGGQCRLPLGPAPDGLEDTARKVLEGLGADGPLG
ncbi:MAG TPA: 4-hydroxy-tetrahydrodipicolinate synthase [Acidimicrobiales bacterium]|nr:4-hydroxy-tetrahydrodipicolinate synthase [Acidimicrobiales bacterium]